MTGQASEETCVHVDADAENCGKTGAHDAKIKPAKLSETIAEVSETSHELNETKAKLNETIPKLIGKDRARKRPWKARARPSELDWMCIRHLIVVEKCSVAELAREYGVTPTAVRQRRRTESWNDLLTLESMPKLEELLVMRNEREIASLLRSMERKRLAARESTLTDKRENTPSPAPENSHAGPSPQQTLPAAKKVDPGGEARALQSISRAIANTVATRGKMKTKIRPPGARMRNLANIENAFQRIREKARAAQNLGPEEE
jgi:hypothetical protein